MPFSSATRRSVVRGRDHAHIDVLRLVAAEPLQFALLQNAQQLHLNRRRHIADFVEHHGAGVGLLEFARLARDCARECALFVAEQLAFHQVFGKRRAIDLDERLVTPRRVKVNGARNQIFAHAALAGQQHRRARRSHAHDRREDLLHRRAAAHDVVELVAEPEFFPQLLIFVAQGADFQRLVEPRSADGRARTASSGNPRRRTSSPPRPFPPIRRR